MCHGATLHTAGTFTTAANIVDQSQYLHPLAPVPTAVAYNDTISAFNAYGSEIVLCSRWVRLWARLRIRVNTPPIVMEGV